MKLFIWIQGQKQSELAPTSIEKEPVTSPLSPWKSRGEVQCAEKNTPLELEL